jgi:hypothetical protein
MTKPARRRTLGFSFVVLLAAAAAGATPVVADDNPIPSPTDPITDTVSDATDPITDTVSDATDPITDTAPGGVSTGGSSTTQAGTQGHTSSREGHDVSCDAQTTTCIQAPAEGGGLAGVVRRILGSIAQTGWAALPWIVVAVGLTALGIFLLRVARHRTTSRT